MRFCWFFILMTLVVALHPICWAQMGQTATPNSAFTPGPDPTEALTSKPTATTPLQPQEKKADSLASPAPTDVNLRSEKPVTLPKFMWAGDFRYRFAKVRESVDDERNYQALRVRLGVSAEVNDEVRTVIRFATGSSAIDQNQTLGDSSDPGMPRRSFGLDWAYLDWKPAVSTRVWLGRTPNPFWEPGQNQLMFYRDVGYTRIYYDLVASF